MHPNHKLVDNCRDHKEDKGQGEKGPQDKDMVAVDADSFLHSLQVQNSVGGLDNMELLL